MNPMMDDVGSFLRAQATYTDGTGEERTLNILSEFTVRVEPTDNVQPNEFNPADNARDVDENSPNGTLVGSPVTTTDSNPSDVLTYTIPVASDASPFAIDKKTGQISVDGTVHHEPVGDNGGTYEVTVSARDPSGLTRTIDITITANDVNEKPSVTESPDSVTSTPEIDSTPTDQDGVPEPDYMYESALVASYTASDADEADMGEGNVPKLTLGGPDAGAFELGEPSNGAVALMFMDDPDFDSPGDANRDNTYEVMVIATDKAGLTGMEDVRVVVTNVAEDGKVILSTDQPAVGQPITAMLDDPDNNETGMKWQWQSSQTGVANSYTNIAGATSDTYTPKEAVPDDPATPNFDESASSDEGMFLLAMVRYRDETSEDVEDDDTTPDMDESLPELAMAASRHAVREAPMVNNEPMFDSATMMREVEENTVKGQNAGERVMATDADGDALTYSITGGADMDMFTIKSNNGQIEVGSADLDYEDGQSSFEVEVTAKDPFGGSGSTMVTLRVTDMNEKPQFMADDPDDYEENGTGPVATFTAMDPEQAGVTWSRMGTDDDAFSITDGVLTFKKSPNYEIPTDVAHIGTRTTLTTRATLKQTTSTWSRSGPPRLPQRTPQERPSTPRSRSGSR